MNLIERLMPRIDTVASSIRRGGFSGLCSVAYEALVAAAITTTEYRTLREAINAYTTKHHAGYVVFNLVPEFDDMTDRPTDFEFPNDVSERAATLWKEWAVNLVTTVGNHLE